MRLTEHRARHLPLPKTEKCFTFCDEVKGFGVSCTPNVRSYIVQLWFNGRKIRITLGRVGVLPFEGPAHAPGARDLAIVAITAARRGEDPYEVPTCSPRMPHAATWSCCKSMPTTPSRGPG